MCRNVENNKSHAMVVEKCSSMGHEEKKCPSIWEETLKKSLVKMCSCNKCLSIYAEMLKSPIVVKKVFVDFYIFGPIDLKCILAC